MELGLEAIDLESVEGAAQVGALIAALRNEVKEQGARCCAPNF